MKIKNLAIVFLFVSFSAFADQDRINGFELKRYSEDRTIAKILNLEFDELEDPACVSAVIDDPQHNALVSVGRYIQTISLKTVNVDEEPTLSVVFEYASVRSKDSVIKKTISCPISGKAESASSVFTDGF